MTGDEAGRRRAGPQAGQGGCGMTGDEAGRREGGPRVDEEGCGLTGDEARPRGAGPQAGQGGYGMTGDEARPRGLARRAAGLRAAAVLAAVATACATGCGVLAAPGAPSGMQKQIMKGEQAGAASQAPAAQQPEPAANAPAARGPVRGRDVTAIGDSVMAASAMTLESVIPGIYVNAKIDREMQDGVAIVRSLAASGQLRPVVVVGLGTNWKVSPAQLSELLRLIGPHRKLVLVNTWRPDDGWSLTTNAEEAAFAREHPGIVVVADWYDLIKNRQDLLWSDHVHPEMPGTYVYAHLLNRAIQATRDVPAPVRQPAVAKQASG
jgi:hypothetical protein